MPLVVGAENGPPADPEQIEQLAGIAEKLWRKAEQWAAQQSQQQSRRHRIIFGRRPSQLFLEYTMTFADGRATLHKDTSPTGLTMVIYQDEGIWCIDRMQTEPVGESGAHTVTTRTDRLVADASPIVSFKSYGSTGEMLTELSTVTSAEPLGAVACDVLTTEMRILDSVARS